MRPTYGVITATLNAATHVRRAIESVWSQSIPPAEFTVVDGGSKDETVGVVQECAEIARRRGMRTRFRLLAQESPGGIAGAWNEAIWSMSSDIVFILNADDWYEPDAALHVLRAFEEAPSAGIVHAKARFLRSDGSSLGICAPTWINRIGLQCRSVHCATFVRRSVYQDVGGFDCTYATTLDVDFIERCWRAGIRFHYVPEVVTNFRLGGVSNSHRAQADWETLCIGLRHSRSKVLPVAAFVVRRLLMRPFGVAGFNLRLRAERDADGAVEPLRGAPTLVAPTAAPAARPAVARGDGA